jgi:tRNA threonylcarbamoyladenosine biosynthesis protein TsaB
VIVLGIHSTTPSLGVALIEDSSVLEEVILPPSRQHLENLAVTIKELLDRQGVSLKRVGGLGVATGPGSFSGIRVGLATAKGMALALGIPVVGCPTLEILAWQALDQGEAGVPVIDARRREVYTAIYRKVNDDLKVIDEPMLIAADLLVQRLRKAGQQCVLCGDPVLDDLIQGMPHVVRSPIRIPSPAVCALLALRKIRRGAGTGVHDVLPVYIRRSDAEENREKRKQGNPA